MSAEIGHNGGPTFNADYPDADGFVAITRSVRAHHVVGFGQPVQGVDDDKPTYSRFEAWADLIMECRFVSGRVMNGGREMELKRGQLIGAVSWLGARWNWSPKTVRIFLDRLEGAGMIEMGYGDQPSVENCDKTAGLVSGETKIAPRTTKGKHKGKQAHVLTICKYALYQLGFRSEGQIKGHGEGQIKGKQGANEGQQVEERKQEKKEIIGKYPLQPSASNAAREKVADEPNGLVDDPVTGEIVAFISASVRVEADVARRMLKSNIAIFGRDAMLEAFAQTQAEMTTGGIAAPYKYFMKVAEAKKRDREVRAAERIDGRAQNFSAAKDRAEIEAARRRLQAI